MEPPQTQPATQPASQQLPVTQDDHATQDDSMGARDRRPSPHGEQPEEPSDKSTSDAVRERPKRQLLEDTDRITTEHNDKNREAAVWVSP